MTTTDIVKTEMSDESRARHLAAYQREADRLRSHSRRVAVNSLASLGASAASAVSCLVTAVAAVVAALIVIG